jgi:hypothetical protein
MAPHLDNESPMEESGLGLLPGIVVALGFVVTAMALLLVDSMLAVFGVLILALLATAVILLVVFALLDEGERGRRLRNAIPGLSERPTS